MEAFTVASSAAGLVSLGIEVCKGLLKYYHSLRTAESDVVGMYNSVEALTKTLILLDKVIKDRMFDGQAVENVEQSILSTQKGITSLRKKLDKIKFVEKGGSWSERTKAPFRKAIYPLKQSVLVKLQELASELRDDLVLALNTLQIDASACTLKRLDLLADRAVDISNGVDYLSEGVNSISIDVRNLQDIAAVTSNGLETLFSLQCDDYYRKVIDWLSPLAREFERKQSDLLNLEGRQDGIGTWLFSTDEFRTWVTDSEGAGKTVLSALIVENLRQRASQENGIAFAYIYCNYKDTEKQTVSNLLSCLIYQLLIQKPHSLIGEVAALYESHHTAGSSPENAKISKTAVLNTAVNNFATVFVVVDALDECSEEDGRRQNLMVELTKLMPIVRLLALSRDIPNIRQQLPNSMLVNIKASDGDVLNYINTRIAKSERLMSYVTKDESLRQLIQTSVAGKACGMFLQVKFHLDSLATKTTLRKLKSALSTLPEGLNETYDEVMQRISAQSRDNYQLARKVIYWVANAMVPLTVPILQQALAVEYGDTSLDIENLPDEDLLISVCAGLINVHEDKEVVDLVHFTAQEYFDDKGRELFPEAQKDMLLTCLMFLSFDEFGNEECYLWEDFKKRLYHYPFLSYAARYWGFHARDVQYDRDCKQRILNFLNQSEHLKHSVQIDILPRTEGFHQLPKLSNYSPLHVAADFGMEEITEILLEAGADAMGMTNWGETPLHRAQTVEVASLLLDSGARIDSRDIVGRTPLMHQTWADREKVVQKLIGLGANIKAISDGGNTPLLEAAENGSDSAAWMLLNSGADVDARNTCTGQTALHLAAKHGDEALTILLLYHGAHVRSKSNVGETALMIAASRGHASVITRLLQQSPYKNVKDDATTDQAGELSAKALLGNIRAVNEADSQGRTALMLAAGVHSHCTDILLLHGADPDTVDKQGRNCLHHAAARGSIQQIKRFLRKGLNPNCADNDGWTPLLWAAKGGRHKNIKMLLDAGANLNTTLQNLWTPYTVAVYHHQQDVLPLLGPKDIRTGVAGATLSSADIYGPRSKCTICPDFDFCFKCVASAKQSHPPHDFETIEEGFEG